MRFLVTISATLLWLCISFSSCKKECSTTPVSKDNIIIVDAGKSQIVTVTGDSIRLNGTVLNGRPTITSYSWTSLVGPNLPTISNKDSLSSLATGLAAGTYIFQLRASSPINVGLDTTTVIVAKSLTLRVDSTNPNTKGFDFKVINSVNVSIVSNKEIFAGSWTSGGFPYETKSAFAFDLNQLPPNSTILSAKLTLYSDSTPLDGDHLGDANSGTNNAFYIERITSYWDYTNTWFTIPATDTANGILIPSTTLSQLDITDLDVTDMVKNMYATNNYGFEIRLQNQVPYTIRVFCGDAYAQADRHPKLEILYQ
jgi:hypothetical protein